MKTSVNTVITNALGQYLLQMRDGKPGICHPLKWNFFGGGLEPRESPLAGAVRETAEEIGFTAGEPSYSLLGSIRDEVQEVHVVRLLPTLERHQVVLQEGAGFGFFAIADLLTIDSTPMTRAIVERFLLPGATQVARS
jgi:8-oxo-dGTP diphosphatase